MMIRHGESEANLSNQDLRDAGLPPLGERQAQLNPSHPCNPWQQHVPTIWAGAISPRPCCLPAHLTDMALALRLSMTN